MVCLFANSARSIDSRELVAIEDRFGLGLYAVDCSQTLPELICDNAAGHVIKLTLFDQNRFLGMVVLRELFSFNFFVPTTTELKGNTSIVDSLPFLKSLEFDGFYQCA